MSAPTALGGPSKLTLGDITIDVVFKDIKNIHLSVHPPLGRVSMVAPGRLNLDTLRLFAIARLGWIRQQRQKMQTQERETPREYLERESHFVWGQRYLLQVTEKATAPTVELSPRHLQLTCRPGTDAAHRQAVLDEWYRQQLRQAVTPLIDRWASVMGVQVRKVFVQRMKTRWGSCNPVQGHLRLNTELARKPPECLEYIVVHEMAHLLEPSHNARFQTLMDGFMPSWRHRRDQLNRLPVSHQDWAQGQGQAQSSP
jgi:predicted metal-dependent hydrolase